MFLFFIFLVSNVCLFFLCVPGHVLCATTVEYSPGVGACKLAYVFLIWCCVIVLGFLFTALEEDTGLCLHLGVIVLPGKASWHWSLKVKYFFFWLDQSLGPR